VILVATQFKALVVMLGSRVRIPPGACTLYAFFLTSSLTSGIPCFGFGLILLSIKMKYFAPPAGLKMFRGKKYTIVIFQTCGFYMKFKIVTGWPTRTVTI
jgi:hypothetical protein